MFFAAEIEKKQKDTIVSLREEIFGISFQTVLANAACK